MKTEKTYEDLHDYFKGHYYSDIEEGILWAPFEYTPEDEIEEFIDNDIQSLVKFLGLELAPSKKEG